LVQVSLATRGKESDQSWYALNVDIIRSHWIGEMFVQLKCRIVTWTGGVMADFVNEVFDMDVSEIIGEAYMRPADILVHSSHAYLA